MNNFSAILELKDAIDFSHRVKPICMPHWASRPYVREQGVVAGWGWDGQAWPAKMKMVDANVNSEDCQQRMDNWWKDREWHTMKEYSV